MKHPPLHSVTVRQAISLLRGADAIRMDATCTVDEQSADDLSDQAALLLLELHTRLEAEERAAEAPGSEVQP